MHMYLYNVIECYTIIKLIYTCFVGVLDRPKKSFYGSTYLIVFHLSELFTYLNKIFVPFDQWGSDNRGFTVLVECTSCMC